MLISSRLDSIGLLDVVWKKKKTQQVLLDETGLDNGAIRELLSSNRYE